jgi:hypothetical protein
MAHWLEIPDVEARIHAADAMPPSLEALRACVELIAAATGQKITVGAGDALLTFRNEKRTRYSVRVVGGDYRVLTSHPADRYEYTATGVEKLAWTVCGFPFTPAETRVAAERAKRDGITGPIPLNYFGVGKTHK